MAQVIKNPPAGQKMQETEFDPWVEKIPCSRTLQPTPVFFLGKSLGQRSLVGYGPWGHKELDMTEVTKHTLFTILKETISHSHAFYNFPMFYFPPWLYTM